ncbi:MAG: hypothetical protein SF029_11125 [bacterium]|nr:hypothetical protein [bacterium]
MPLLLIALGGLGAVLYVVVLLVRNIAKPFSLRGLDLLLLAAFVVLLLAGNVLEAQADSVWDREEWLAATFSLLLIVGGLVSGGLNLTRREKTSGGRGLLGVVVGVLMIAITVAAPALATRTTLDETVTELPTATPGATQTSRERALNVFNAVVDVIAAETGLDVETVATNLDEGINVVQMVSDNGGDLELIIAQISDILTAQVEATLADGRMNSFTASLLISQMDNIVRLGVNTDLTGALSRFETPEDAATPEATPAS